MASKDDMNEVGEIDLKVGSDGTEDFSLVRTKRASFHSSLKMIMADASEDQRSHWHWFRLANGDLIFGCFPRGDLYFELENDHSF